MRTIQLSRDVVSRHLSDEAVLLSFTTGSYPKETLRADLANLFRDQVSKGVICVVE